MKRISSPSDENPEAKRTCAIAPDDETHEQALVEVGLQNQQSVVVCQEEITEKSSRSFCEEVDHDADGSPPLIYLTGIGSVLMEVEATEMSDSNVLDAAMTNIAVKAGIVLSKNFI